MRIRDKLNFETLQLSINEFRLNDLFCDVTLVVDECEFKAHKLILVAASPYFRIMFDTKYSFIESKQDKVIIQGVEKNAFSNILNYIYSSVIDIDDSNLYPLMEAVSLLQIHSLTTYITFYVQNTLTVDNCLHAYVMAHFYQYQDLANEIFYFVLVNFSYLVDKVDYLKLPFDILLKIVSSKLLLVLDEATLCEHILRWVEEDIKNRRQYIDSLISEISLTSIPKETLKKLLNNSLITINLRDEIQGILGFPLASAKDFSFPEITLRKHRYESEIQVIFAIGGESCGNASHSVECYAPGIGEWKYVVPEIIIKRHETKFLNVLPPLRCARYYAGSAYNLYNVYVLGGRNSESLLDECEVFNIKTNQWNYFSKLPEKIFGCGAAFLGDELFVIGGCGENGVLSKVWKLGTQKTWVPIPSISSPRYFHCTVSVGGYIFVLGGYSKVENCVLRKCEKFDPVNKRWMEISSMHHPRAKFGAAAFKNCIYVFGGTNDESDCLKSVERYNIITNEWSYENSMIVPRHSFGVANSGREVYCLGGKDCYHFLDSVEKFSLRTKRWLNVHSMKISRVGPAAAALSVPFTSHYF